MHIFEALGQIRVNRVFSPIRIEIRMIRVQSSLLSQFFGRSIRKKEVFFCFFFFRSENRFAENIRDSENKLKTTMIKVIFIFWAKDP